MDINPRHLRHQGVGSKQRSLRPPVIRSSEENQEISRSSVFSGAISLVQKEKDLCAATNINREHQDNDIHSKHTSTPASTYRLHIATASSSYSFRRTSTKSDERSSKKIFKQLARRHSHHFCIIVNDSIFKLIDKTLSPHVNILTVTSIGLIHS